MRLPNHQYTMHERIDSSTRAQIGRKTAIAAAVVLVVVVTTAGAVLLGGVPGDAPSPGGGNGTTTTLETTSTTGTTTTTGETDAPTTNTSETTGTTTTSTANATTSTDATTGTTTTTTTSTATTTTATTATTTNGSPQFAFRIHSIEKCGSSCRDVSTGLVNEGSAPAENVTVEVNVYAGENRVWRDTEEVGTLGPGETYNSTEHVEVGPGEAYQIQQNGGYVTIETVVRYDGGSETFTRRKKVM